MSKSSRISLRFILLSAAVIALFDTWFYVHYMDIIGDTFSYLKALVIIDFSLVCFFFSLRHYQSIINPIGLYSIFIFLWGYSYIPLTMNQQTNYSLLTEMILLVAILCFMTGALWPGKIWRFTLKYFDQSLLSVMFLAMVCSCTLAFLFEVAKIGYFPILNLSHQTYGDVIHNLIPFVHYLSLFLCLMPAIAFVYYKNSIIDRNLFILVVLIALFAMLNLLGRQNILLLFISVFFAYGFFKKISNLTILTVMATGVLLFILLGYLREASADAALVHYALKKYAGITADTNILETYLGLYASQNYSTLDKISGLAYTNEFWGMGMYTFRPLVSLLFLDRIGLVEYTLQYNGEMQLGTYALEAYLDFKMVGVVVINLVYGRVAAIAYNSYREKRSWFSIISWSLVSFCILMTSFTNYFNQFFVWLAAVFSFFLLNTSANEKDIGLHNHL